ncbi:cytidylyltransferase domain-containing protein [Spirochaeta africana]|uniref:Spore coat polysaccharide biosynthesis protein F, CMP-KDO synthetase n=1 Tax=Spirochaeta africana (strain ATCC 700263 / DSM 8902 / Z-7692) TaxID=889378 RepID=H9UJP1_SPIAZ|nr:NTP transferase domain-containing protein [Spirochaeta africana]AFG37734.1 spore coat polysaccharide biosynthesis protein F, CMP-KDO synthetase [Spirochaeta africana DSM 8902]
MTGILLQARIDSQRLPRKILLPIAGKPLLQHAMENLLAVPADVYAVVTDEASLPELQPLCGRCGFQVIAGHPTDVLARYHRAAEQLGLDTVVRATGDNPLVSPEIADASLQLARQTAADYAGLLHPPYGTAVEVLRADALARAYRDAASSGEREHVTAYIYGNPELFRLALQPAPDSWRSSARVTVDTPEDLAYMRRLFAELYSGSPIPITDVIQWCSRNPHARLKVS